MHRLLIVDDEPFIVNGLEQFFIRQELPHLEIYKAYSSKEALAWMDRMKVDIVLTDIQMPGMNGLELQKRIMAQWPCCKVIFLTGYNDFAYIQNALRNESVDYLLKTGDQEEILNAVRKAINKLEQEVEMNDILLKARQQMRSALPYLQFELLRGVLSHPRIRGDLQEQFDDLDIPLDAGRPVLSLLCRVDDWREEMGSRDKSLLIYAIRNIAEELLGRIARLIALEYDKSKLVWFIQPIDTVDVEAWSRLTRFVHGTLEQIQSACKSLLKLRISFIADGGPVPWERIGERQEELNVYFTFGFGLDEEMLHIQADRPKSPQDNRELNEVAVSPRSAKRIGLLAEYLDSGHREMFNQAFTDLFGHEEEMAQVEKNVKLEIYYTLVSIFLSRLNAWSLYQEIAKVIDLTKLIQMEEHVSWNEAVKYFRRLADAIFELKTVGMVQQQSDVIERLNAYIEQHLGDDLSLTRLAEVVSLSPSYLSRLYKQITGSGLSEIITEKRIAKAKQLLQDAKFTVNDVAVALGFIYPNLFYRFFKKATDMTPQEYRDEHIK